MNKLFWLIFSIITFGLVLFFIINPEIKYGGDIVEYYGNSESFINHLSFNLTDSDKAKLIERLSQGYFDNPEYYIKGLDGQRYTVHFPLYSVMLVPGRLFLRAIGQDEYKTFQMTNLFILTLLSVFILLSFIKSPVNRFAYLIAVYASPIIWHLVWPGPEIFEFSMILLSIYLFFHGRQMEKVAAIVLSALASYQSQPILFIPLAYMIIMYWNKYVSKKTVNRLTLRQDILIAVVLLIFIAVPNIYYYAVFGVLSAWFKLTDVGFENSSLKKSIELFFDPNLGLLFYMPILFIEGITGFIKSLFKSVESRILLIMLSLATSFYLINTNWNNGTAGYGPTRYAMHLLPLICYFFLENLIKVRKAWIVLSLVVIGQLYVMSFNGWLVPDFEKTVKHSPIAEFILKRYPSIYNPTPEIFVERTTGQEGGYWNSTAYLDNGKCLKAYILKTDIQRIVDQCGDITERDLTRLENTYLNMASYPRMVITSEATFYPADGACAWDVPEDFPFSCMRTIEDVVKATGIKDEGRFENLDNTVGLWQLHWGRPAKVMVPPGYIIHHYSFEGAYVNF